MEADDLRKHHRDGLAEHDGLSLDTANTPAGNTEAIDHGCMRIGTNDGVGVEHIVLVENNTREVLEIDLMDDTRARRHDLEVVESLGAPLEELEAFAVTSELETLVCFTGIANARGINLNGVINDEINWAERVDLAGVTTETLHGITHGSEIDYSGYTSEILEDDTGGAEGNLGIVLRGLLPVEDGLNVVLLDAEVVAVTDGTLEEHADRVREGGDARVAEGREIVVIVASTTVL